MVQLVSIPSPSRKRCLSSVKGPYQAKVRMFLYQGHSVWSKSCFCITGCSDDEVENLDENKCFRSDFSTSRNAFNDFISCFKIYFLKKINLEIAVFPYRFVLTPSNYTLAQAKCASGSSQLVSLGSVGTAFFTAVFNPDFVNSLNFRSGQLKLII